MSLFMVSAAKAKFVLHSWQVSLVLSCSVALGKTPRANVAVSRGDSGSECSSPPVNIGSDREQEELGQQMHTDFPDNYISLATPTACCANSYWIVICLSQPSHLWLHGLAYAAFRLGS